ncbi:MAG: PIN domain-containing protein [Thermomicrobiales bacterium]
MSDLVVVLDACVLVPAALRDTLLRAAQEMLYKPLWSEIILAELSRTLINEGMTDASRAARLLDTLRTFFPDSTVGGIEPFIDQMTNHPKDRHVLAAAVVGGATILVTSNLRDFPDAAAEPWDVEIQSPDEFLCHLLALEPDLLCEIVRRQGAELRQPRSPQAVLDRLATLGGATFAARVAAHLGLADS